MHCSFFAANAVLLALLATTTSAQQTWYVDAAASPGGSGGLNDPYATIQAALTASETQVGDRVLVAAGTYAESLDFGGKAVGLIGAGREQTWIDAQGAGSVVRLVGTGDKTLIDGFTLTGGAALEGGGLFVQDAALDLRACDVVDNAATGAGGGLFARRSDVLLENCTLANNETGGGLAAQDARVVLRGVTLRDNRRFSQPSGPASGASFEDCATSVAFCSFERNGDLLPFLRDRGGALWARGGSLQIVGTLFDANESEYRGGALSLADVRAVVSSCTFTDNRSVDLFVGGAVHVDTNAPGTELAILESHFSGGVAGDGGAVYVGAGSARCVGCTFANNTAESDAALPESGLGGALYAASGAQVSATRCVFVDNTARGDGLGQSGEGGGVWGAVSLERCTLYANVAEPAFGPAAGGGAYGATLRHCIVWGCSPDGLDGPASVSWSDIQEVWPGAGNLSVDPRFWSPEPRDLHLVPDSPCIDAGDPERAFDGDGSVADLGAFPADAPYAPAPSTYCEGLANSAGCVPAIGWSGTPTLRGDDDFHVRAVDVVSGQVGFLLYGAFRGELPFFGGTLCVEPPLLRSALLFSGGTPGGMDCTGLLDAPLSHAFLGAGAFAPGTPVYAQFWYRDPGAAGLAGLSDALVFTLLADER